MTQRPTTQSQTVAPNSQGIDTIELIANYKTVIKMVERMGLKATTAPKGSPVSDDIKDLLKKYKLNSKKRYKAEKFSPVVEVVKLTKGKSVSNYMIITKNIPILFNHATHHKKPKDTFCLITFAGLHQPSKKVNSEAMKIMSKFLKRKAFKLHSLDMAFDVFDPKPINEEGLKAFTERFKALSKHGVKLIHNSYYINKIEHLVISRILYYAKYLKMTEHHKQKNIPTNWKDWKRLEITLTFDLHDLNNKGFIDYSNSLNFANDFYELEEVATKAKFKSYDHDYLEYQVNSLLDNRVLNNKESKEQFNSVQSLKRFKSSNFRRVDLNLLT